MNVTILPISNLPEVKPGDDLVGLFEQAEPTLEPGDILVVTQKVVSKAEGRLVSLAEVKPGPKALEIAARWDKDPALVELVLKESSQRGYRSL